MSKTITTGFEAISQGKVCPYCFRPTKYMDSKTFYGGRSYGMVWACVPCVAWVGCHRDTQTALGRVANAELRKAKVDAHSYLDALWLAKVKRDLVSKFVARGAAYKWLSEQMGIDPQYCHIGMFDVEQCHKVIELCKPYIKN